MARNQDLNYQFADVAGLLNFVHGLSQWIYTRPDADERDRLTDLLYATPPCATPTTMIPLYLSLPEESANWPIKPGTLDGASAIPAMPANLKPLSWTNLALLVALEPAPAALHRDDLVFVVQGVRDDLLAILDAIFELERDHPEDVQLLIAPIDPESLGGLRLAKPAGRSRLERSRIRWTAQEESAESGSAPDKAAAALIKVSGLRRFYLLEKTVTDPHLRLFYRHLFPPYVPVPPGLQLYVEWGYQYMLPPASFIMEAWQRDKLGLVLLPAPGAGGPLVVSSALTFRPVLQVARDVRLADAVGHTELTPTGETDSNLLDLEMRLRKRPVGDVKENEQALRHRIQNDLWRLQRLLTRERDAKARRLYVYADDDPGDMARLRSFILDNPLSILNEFRYFCGRLRDQVYHLVLLPLEDGTNAVTPDRFPTPPTAARVFRREPSWMTPDASCAVYIPRDTELFPSLAQGLEMREELLRQALGLTADQVESVLVLLWPEPDAALTNYHLPLDGFIPLGQAGHLLNAHVLTPEVATAISIQVFDGLRKALHGQALEEIRLLQDQITDTYRNAWDKAHEELDQLLEQGIQIERLAKTVQKRFADVDGLAGQQLDQWNDFLARVVAMAAEIEAQAARDESSADLAAQRGALRERLEQVIQAVHNMPDEAQERRDLADKLEALAAELRAAEE